MKLSVVIPAYNEAGCIESTLRAVHSTLRAEQIPFELVVVDDNSSDATPDILRRLTEEMPELRPIRNTPPHGFGFAVRCGLERFQGDAVAVFMADASDNPEDLVKFYRRMVATGADCVFGTRWDRRSIVRDYPIHKLILNRLVNTGIRVLFAIRYNDTTNAFKLYSARTLQGLKPFLSHHFNLTVELPLKAIVRGYSYEVVPNDWANRKTGVSNLRIAEMGSRYLFIILYCLLERWLSRGDYHSKRVPRVVPKPAESA